MTKRISIVTVSIILIGNQVTASNVCGMLMAILGVFYYNKVKYEENKARSTLPTTMTPSSGGVEKKGGSILWQNQRGVAEDAHHVKLITSRAPPQHVRIILSFVLFILQPSHDPRLFLRSKVHPAEQGASWHVGKEAELYSSSKLN